MSESMQTEEPDKNETEWARSLFGQTKHVPTKSGFKHVGPSYGARDM